MFSKLKHIRIELLFLIIGILSYIFSIQLSDSAHYIHEFAFSVFTLCFLFALDRISDKVSVFNIEYMLRYLSFGIIFILALLFLSPWLKQATNILSRIIQFTEYAYVIFIFTQYKKFIYHKINTITQYVWHILLSVIVIGTVFSQYFQNNYDKPLSIVLISVYFFTIAYLIFRLRWIALLNIRSRWQVLLLMLLINICILFLFFDIDENRHDISTRAFLWGNLGYTAINCFILSYGFMSFLALLFSMPLHFIIEEKEEEISSLQALGKIIQNPNQKDQIFGELLTACVKSTHSDAAWLKVAANKNDIMSIKQGVIYEDEISSMDEILTVLTSISKVQDKIYVANTDKDESFKVLINDFKSFLYVPIIINKQFLGKMVLLKNSPNGFDEYFIKIAQDYVTKVQLSCEHDLFLKERLDTERVKSDLLAAQKIQAQLLPDISPKNNFFDIAAKSITAQETGGDLYDFYQFNEHQFGVIIGDVSGKGLSAAMHMAQLKGIISSLILQNHEPKKFLLAANKAVSICFEKAIFATLSYVFIDTKSKTISHTRAGHCPMLYYNSQTKKCNYILGDGLGMGINDTIFEQKLEVKKFKYKSNDMILLFTDGIIEAGYESKNPFAYDELSKYIEQNANQNVETLQKGIFEKISSYTKEGNLHDDSTLILLKFL